MSFPCGSRYFFAFSGFRSCVGSLPHGRSTESIILAKMLRKARVSSRKIAKLGIDLLGGKLRFTQPLIFGLLNLLQ